ncbi:TrkA family potassium uptake protein [Brachybacterium sp. EF45031]|uniref:potassium channel family protein n=1 Tax=Brachybacterium sillae TaxID=2810536 RepID=UPI00217F0F48|nr:TrkA family potassium uptake protein [Brachybacterium sillae]MCS6711439.1 TrkA family potassium uptake protein [Brachybacterium sillae]
MARSPFFPSRRHEGRDGVRGGEDRVRTVAVLGLGRFGATLARELAQMGVEVLGVDAHEDIVQDLDPHLTHTVRADISRAEVLEQLGVAEADRVVVAVGGRLEVSVLACSHLLALGVRELWAKADTEAHGLILQQLGVPHVVMPQKAMGRQVAHRLVDRAEDWVDYGGGLILARFSAPQPLFHRTAADARLGGHDDLRIIARMGAGPASAAGWEYVTPQTEFLPGDELIVAGSAAQLERFGRLAHDD